MSDKADDILGRVIFDLLRVAGRLQQAGDGLVGDLGLTHARWQVLATAGFVAPPETVSGLARRLGLTRQAVQRVVNDLAEAGWVTRAENPGDARAALVEVTAAGRAVLAAADARRKRWTADLAAGMAAGDVATAETVLADLRRALDRA